MEPHHLVPIVTFVEKLIEKHLNVSTHQKFLTQSVRLMHGRRASFLKRGGAFQSVQLRHSINHSEAFEKDFKWHFRPGSEDLMLHRN